MDITDFNEYVYPDVRGCPTADVTRAVRDAATEFLTFSGAWKEVQEPMPLVADERQYFLSAPTDGRCIDILNVYTLAGELIPQTLQQLAVTFPDWQSCEGNVPSHYTRAKDYTSIDVYPLPTDPGSETLTFHAVYTLRDTATTIPDEIVYRYKDALVSGALKRLLAMARTPWQDLKLAAYHAGQFQDAKEAARITARHDKTAGHITVPSRVFGM